MTDTPRTTEWSTWAILRNNKIVNICEDRKLLEGMFKYNDEIIPVMIYGGLSSRIDTERTARLEAERALELLGSTNKIADDHRKHLEAQLTTLQKERDEYQALFDIQHTRSVEAEARWCKAHGYEPGSIKPDLGKLLEWLMSERDQALAELRKAGEVFKKIHQEVYTSDDFREKNHRMLNVAEEALSSDLMKKVLESGGEE